MHISDGVLSGPVLAAGWAGTAAFTFLTARKMDIEEIPKVAVLAAVFFVGSMIRFPLGAASVHLILNGLVGTLLGKRAYLAILLGLVLQATLFGHGGVSVIGVNALMMGVGALAAWGVWSARTLVSFKSRDVVFGGLAGATGVFISGVILAAVMVTTGDAFIGIAKTVLGIHVVILIFEGLVVAGCVGYLKKVRPDMLIGGGVPRSRDVASPAVAAAPVSAKPESDVGHDDGGGAGPKAMMIGLIAAGLLASLTLVPNAQAHKLLIDYTPLKEGVLIEAFFPDGKPARDIVVRLMDTGEKVLATGHTDHNGGYVFPISARVDYLADADAKMGHYTKMLVPAEDLAEVELGVSAAMANAAGDRPSKVKSEAIPWGRIAFGIGIFAIIGFAAKRLGKNSAA